MSAVAHAVAAWAATLNRLPPGDVPTAAAALGLAAGSPPDGLTDVVIDERAGDVFSVRATVVPGALTRADLDAVLGPGRSLPRVHWHDPVPLGYLVEVLGEAFTCTVFAYFARDPEPGEAVVSLMLRRDRSLRSFPGHHTVADLPVLLEQLPSGEIAALALDLRSGAFVRDDGYLRRIAGRPANAEELDRPAFDRLVSVLRRAASHARQVRPVTWHPTGDPGHGHRAELDGVTYLLSEGDFPVEPRYTLTVDGQEVDHLDTWPTAWRRATEPVGAAVRFVAQHFPAAIAAFLGGSAESGYRTATSDLDVVVIVDGPPAPFRETTEHEGWPVELFCHTVDSLRSFVERETATRRCPLLHMVGEGALLLDRDGTGRRIRDDAVARLRAGPPPPSATELEDRRYLVTDLLDDLAGSVDADESVFIANRMLVAVGELLLVLHGQWLGQGKWLLRRLRDAAPEICAEFLSGYRRLVNDGDPTEFVRVTNSVLDQAGGRLFTGYRREASQRA